MKKDTLLILAFCFFVGSIPFEGSVSLLQGAEGNNIFTISKLVGLLFFGVVLWNGRRFFRPIPTAFWLFAAYHVLLALSIIQVPPMYYSAFFGILGQKLQNLLMFLVAYNVFRTVPRSQVAFLVYGGACILAAVLFQFGILNADIGRSDRESFQGEDPNTAAAALALGVVCLAGFAAGGRSLKERRIAIALLLIGIGIIGKTMLALGSRGGMIALMVGVLTLSLPAGKHNKNLFPLLLVALLMLLIGYQLITSIQGSAGQTRWERAYYEGDRSGRNYLWLAAWDLFCARPLLGYGQVVNYVELGLSVGSSMKDTHNLVLCILTEVGIVGALPYLVALGMAGVSGFRAWRVSGTALPLALLTTVFVVNMSLTWQRSKMHWLAIAYALAAGAQVVRTARNQLKAGNARILPRGVRPGVGLAHVGAAVPARASRMSE